VFPNVFGVTEEIALLIYSRSYTAIPTFGQHTWSFGYTKRKIQRGYDGGARKPRDWFVPFNPSVYKMFIQRLQLESLSVEGHHPVEGKRLVQGVPSAGLQITESYGDNLYCSWSSLERSRLSHSMTR
jgi:hypothetical protein